MAVVVIFFVGEDCTSNEKALPWSGNDAVVVSTSLTVSSTSLPTNLTINPTTNPTTTSPINHLTYHITNSPGRAA